MLHTIAACFALAQSSTTTDAIEVESRIRSVDVYPAAALVTRVGELPAGDGRVIVRGLPHSLVVSSLRLRAPGSEIVALETRERRERTVPADSIRSAQTRLEAVRQDIRVASDEISVLEVLVRHFTTLSDESAKGAGAQDLTTEQRLATIATVREQLSALSSERRGVRARLTELESERQRLEEDLARWHQGETTLFHDVILDLLDTDGSADPFELEYQVNGAHWEPFYDLRVAAELDGVELIHRARVHQRTGEDWSGVELALSTARPERGLAAPEPRIHWLDLWEKPAAGMVMSPAAERSASPAELLDFSSGSGISSDADRAASGRWASIVADGVNLRYVLPRPQMVESRPEPTAVLVGHAPLTVAMERVCLPGLSPTVWLRGRATNTTPWVLLEGDATVYIGSNFLGVTPLSRIQTGAEFDLPLGEDPSVVVERIQTENNHEQPGIFGSRVKAFETYKLNITNTSTKNMRLVVHESLPRARDDRIEVAIERANPALATGDRWATLREERGVITWELDLAAGDKRTVDLRLSFAYPQKATLIRR